MVILFRNSVEGDVAGEDDKQWITPKEVARRLNVTRDTAYKMLQEGRLPATRVGALWRVPVVALEAMIERTSCDEASGMPTARYKIGDHVVKHGGEYTISGEVRAALTTRAGKLRYVVEVVPPGGMLMIYKESQLWPA